MVCADVASRPHWLCTRRSLVMSQSIWAHQCGELRLLSVLKVDVFFIRQVASLRQVAGLSRQPDEARNLTGVCRGGIQTALVLYESERKNERERERETERVRERGGGQERGLTCGTLQRCACNVLVSRFSGELWVLPSLPNGWYLPAHPNRVVRTDQKALRPLRPRYRGTLLIRNTLSVGTVSSPMPRALLWS